MSTVLNEYMMMMIWWWWNCFKRNWNERIGNWKVLL